MPKITMEDIYAEIERIRQARDSDDGWFTTRDIVEATGRSDKWVHANIMRPLIQSGRAETGRIQRHSLWGTPVMVPAMRLIEMETT